MEVGVGVEVESEVEVVVEAGSRPLTSVTSKSL